MTDADQSPRKELDGSRLSEIALQQALLDFEVANARVLDLTDRLTELTGQLLEVRQQLESERLVTSQVQVELDQTRQAFDQMRSSLAYRALRFFGDVRAKVLH